MVHPSRTHKLWALAAAIFRIAFFVVHFAFFTAADASTQFLVKLISFLAVVAGLKVALALAL